MASGQKPIKVCLTNRGKDSETPWAEDLGPAPGGGRKVRLVNVPFLHAKPTWGDTIVVKPGDDGVLTWDRSGVSFSKVDSQILEDGDRWAMIVDYVPHPDGEGAYSALIRAAAEHDIVCEGAWGPRDDEPGRVYLAVRSALSDRHVMKRLRAADLPCELIQIHPTPQASKPAKKPAAPAPAKKPAAAAPAKKPAPAAAKKPAAKKAAAPAKKPAAKKPPAPPPRKKR